MGTKNNPGTFDCYANAHPNEPMFVLLGRDKHASLLVRVWALLRHRADEDPSKIAEALQCADAMEAWARSLGKAPFIHEPLLIAATDGLTDHPDDYDHACNCDECCTYQ